MPVPHSSSAGSLKDSALNLHRVTVTALKQPQKAARLSNANLFKDPVNIPREPKHLPLARICYPLRAAHWLSVWQLSSVQSGHMLIQGCLDRSTLSRNGETCVAGKGTYLTRWGKHKMSCPSR